MPSRGAHILYEPFHMKATLCLPTKAGAWFPGVGKTQPQGTERGLRGQPTPRAPSTPQGCSTPQGALGVGASRAQAAGVGQENPPQGEGSFFQAPGCLGSPRPVPPCRGVDGLKVGLPGDSLPWGLRCRQPFPTRAHRLSCPQAGRPSSAAPGSPWAVCRAQAGSSPTTDQSRSGFGMSETPTPLQATLKGGKQDWESITRPWKNPSAQQLSPSSAPRAAR